MVFSLVWSRWELRFNVFWRSLRSMTANGAWRVATRSLLLVGMSLLLCSCQTEDLYSQLSEAEANEMLGILLARDIQATKQAEKENLYSVAVPRDQFSQAVDLLKWYGIPREQFDGIGTMFQKSGIVSSPTEEKVRFMYALSQNIAETLSQIDGVITARVNLVLPNNDPYANVSTPSSASVFLKFRPGLVPETLVPQIKTLVMNSVEGLQYDNITVTVMQSENVDFYSPQRQSVPMTQVFGFKVAESAAGPLKIIFSISASLLILLIGLGVWVVMEMRRRKAEAATANESQTGQPAASRA